MMYIIKHDMVLLGHLWVATLYHSTKIEIVGKFGAQYGCGWKAPVWRPSAQTGVYCCGWPFTVH